MKKPSPLPEEDADLDTQIAQAEQRLIAREQRLRIRGAALGQRAQRAVAPSRWLGPLLGGAAVLWTIGRLLGRRRTPVAVKGASLPSPSAHSVGDAPWKALPALAWLLLPLMWRTRMTQATAGRLISTGLPLAQRLLGRRR